MIKQIMIALILVIGLSGSVLALTDINTSTIQLVGTYDSAGVHEYKAIANTLGIVGNYTLYAYYSATLCRKYNNYDSVKSTIQPAGGTQACDGNNNCGDGTYAVCAFYTRPGASAPNVIHVSGNGYMNGACDGSSYACLYMQLAQSSLSCDVSYGFLKAYIIYTDNSIYTISGTTGCLDNVSLYYDNSSGWDFMGEHNITDNYYSFNITSGIDFKLIFDDGHSYEFNVTEDTVYDYNGCITTKYNFTESCGNLIPDSEGFYIEKIGSTVHAANNFYVPSGILSISQSPADNIYVSANPFSGQIGWFLDPITNGTTYTVTNPVISWSLKVIVQNESTDVLIDDAMVKVNQSCYCTAGYSTRQKMTTNGHADFTDMSLQDAGLFVMKTGYKILDASNTGYAAFLSGRSNFSSKTWVVKLAPSWSENESTFYESNNTVNIFFKNEDGNRTSKILDTDSEVYLYYENNNTEEEDMTLRFESSSTHSYFMPELSWNIPFGEIGHKTIPQSNFTPYDYSYRAVIYNSSIYGWNMTIPLTVRNATKEENQHYENLSTDLWFMYADAGKIDYRSDLDMGVHACSNNTTLMTVDIELYKDNVLLCYKNMSASNFINADFPYYYIWSPTYSYESDSNYSVRMYGFDRTLLETDYVDCYTDDVTRKNKLTIIVKNQYGTNLNNVFVYLEDYGSIPTGTNYYASFEGLNNGYYRFKATKPGYVGTGWDDITLSDSDEIVTYILTSTDSEESSATQPQKMDENELQNIYLIIMAFLLIFIIIGGLKYAL